MLTSLAQDVRDAMMDYQVCTRVTTAGTTSELVPKTALQQDIHHKNRQIIVGLAIR